MKKPLALALAALALGTVGLAQIRALTLTEMVELSEGAVYGEITSSVVSRVVDPAGGYLYYTTLTVEGTSLGEGTDVTVDVAFPGGFVNEEEGLWNSESPDPDDVAVGNRIVAFYKWDTALAGTQAANWLYANHGGQYRTVEGPAGRVVLGRGNGYAVSHNIKLADLDQSVKNIREAIRDRKDR